MKTTDGRRLFRFGKIFWPSSGIRRHMVSHGIKDGVVPECVRFCFGIDVLICWTNESMKRQYIHIFLFAVDINSQQTSNDFRGMRVFRNKRSDHRRLHTKLFIIIFLTFFFCSRIFSELHCRRPFSIHRRLVVVFRAREMGTHRLCVLWPANARWMHRTSIVFIK